jgi:hypothetical protein
MKNFSTPNRLLRPALSLVPVYAPRPSVSDVPKLVQPGRTAEPMPYPKAEAVMRKLVTITETDLMAHDDPDHGHPGRMAGRKLGGFCRSAAHVLGYYATRNGHEANTYQMRDVHEFFNAGAADPELIREAAFGHAAATVKIGTALFLGEHTFGQFCDEDTIRQSADQDTGIPSTDPLAQQLIQDCYVPLTDETLRAYLRRTTGASPDVTEYIEEATVDQMLAKVTPLTYYFSDAEIASGAMWHGVPCTEQPFPCARP